MLPRITGEAVVVMDPEVKFLDNGKTMVRLRVAAKTRKKDGDRWTDGDSSFFNIVVWSPFSDNFIEMNVLKGETVVFAGTMQERQYEKDQEKRSSYSINIGGAEDHVSVSTRWPRKEAASMSNAQEKLKSAKAALNEGWDDNPPF